MFTNLKYWIVKYIEKIPLLQIIIYNNLNFLKFLLPHDKDYFALKLLFHSNERRLFVDVGGNIGLSSMGFRSLGFKNNKILIFEPDKFLLEKYLRKLKKKIYNLVIYPFGLSHKNEKKILYSAHYKKNFFHFNNSFDHKYILDKIKNNYPNQYKKFIIKKKLFSLKKFDSLNIKNAICFVKIDVEGHDHNVLYGMSDLIKRNFPTFLVEYNKSNFYKVYKFLRKNYDCFFYNLNLNKLIKLDQIDIAKLVRGNTLEKDYKKNSVNIFFIYKNIKKT